MKSKLIPALIALVVSPAFCFAADNWVLRQDGYGPLRYGMTLAAVQKRIGSLQTVENSCADFRSLSHPEIHLVFENGRLVLASNSHDSKLSTADGLFIGGPASSLKRLYPGRIKQDYENYDLPSQPGATSYVADVAAGRYTWRFYVGDGKITHITSSFATAIDACVD